MNGEPFEISGPMTLAALLAELSIDPRVVAVEHNLVIVKRAQYDTVVVQPGDEIEVVNFVGGGSACG
jgi:thiamine biosynthesis protein ThiS